MVRNFQFLKTIPQNSTKKPQENLKKFQKRQLVTFLLGKFGHRPPKTVKNYQKNVNSKFGISKFSMGPP